ncbi:hypothetical protein ABT288_43180 [Streptomyces sp. NPDC001093]|uniref:hypothetical protein n=1 Tax=Streptomyces sp. NPDC001093 TaxID=3154376 RepID=UPI0033180EA3
MPGDIDALAEVLGPTSPQTVSVPAVLRTDFLGPVMNHPRLNTGHRASSAVTLQGEDRLGR